MKITVNDRSSFAISQRERTDEGFLRVPGRVARTGVQDYLARELGLDGDPNRLVKVYRPPEEVFNADSLASYMGADVTVEHPKQFVDADTYKATSAGVTVSEGRQDGDFVICDLIVKDAKAVKAVDSGKVQLSAGYSAEYDSDVPEDLKAQGIEFIQRDIKINHVALVDRARAGAQARLFDSEKGKTMAIVTLDSGRTVELEDAQAALVQDSLDRRQQAVDAAEKKAEEAEDMAEKAKAEKDAMKEELEEEKKKSSDSAIAERVKLIADTAATARKIVGDAGEVSDSVDPVEIMRSALSVKFGDKVAWADQSPAYIQGRFDMAAEQTVDAEATKATHDGLAADMAQDSKPEQSARQKWIDGITRAHKGAE